MLIDLTKIITNQVSILNINESFTISKEIYQSTLIDSLENLNVSAKLKYNEDNEIIINGVITGTMYLKDDITLEQVKYNFKTDFEDNVDSSSIKVDIIDILWQNILTEIPSKVRNSNENYEISGNGWRVISEETYEKERNSNNPFANLEELIKAKEEK